MTSRWKQGGNEDGRENVRAGKVLESRWEPTRVDGLIQGNKPRWRATCQLRGARPVTVAFTALMVKANEGVILTPVGSWSLSRRQPHIPRMGK